MGRTTTLEHLALIGWAGLLVLGFGVIGLHARSPGDAGSAGAMWPAHTSLARRDGHPCVVLFMHPRCPCTRATLRQLERALAPAYTDIDLHVVVFDPTRRPGVDTQWPHTGLLDLARSLPGAHISLDPEGAETTRFGIRTSGHILVFDARGTLTFSGGITPARAHEGPASGLDALTHALRGQAPALTTAPVFGCPILDPPTPSASACGPEGGTCPLP